MVKARNCTCDLGYQCRSCFDKERKEYLKRNKIEFGVFLWRPDGVYNRSDALAVFKREATADTWCDTHADEYGGLHKMAVRDVYPEGH